MEPGSRWEDGLEQGPDVPRAANLDLEVLRKSPKLSSNRENLPSDPREAGRHLEGIHDNQHGAWNPDPCAIRL